MMLIWRPISDCCQEAGIYRITRVMVRGWVHRWLASRAVTAHVRAPLHPDGGFESPQQAREACEDDAVLHAPARDAKEAAANLTARIDRARLAFHAARTPMARAEHGRELSRLLTLADLREATRRTPGGLELREVDAGLIAAKRVMDPGP